MSIEYTIRIPNGNYLEYSVFTNNGFDKVDMQIKPTEDKLFHCDVFTHNGVNPILKHSSVRLNENIPAVLILNGNKTYGRLNKRLLYKCVPDDHRIPSFLVPYEIKRMGFSKNIQNLYVTIKFINWDNTHPIGQLVQVIGNVDDLTSFYDYQLYCKSLNVVMKPFEKQVTSSIKKLKDLYDDIIVGIKNKYDNILVNKLHLNNIITIDPPNSIEFDDAVSIYEIEDNYIISLYISNVTIWLNELNLWGSFTKRISSIYLPDKKRPMLPTQLSEGLCSLKEGVERFAFVLDIEINKKTYKIKDVRFYNSVIKVVKNYRYECDELLKNPEYQKIFNVVKGMADSKLNKQLSHNYTIQHSHDVICYLMSIMNSICAQKMLFAREGIFRSNNLLKPVPLQKEKENNFPDQVSNFIYNWKNINCQYIDVCKVPSDEIESSIRHPTLNVCAYLHITSPIRRLVDILNMIKFQNIHGLLPQSDNSINFYNNWINQLEYINTASRSIKKLQTNCELLDMFSKNSQMLSRLYDGYCFDKIDRCDGLFQYMVYIPELKIVTRLTTSDDISTNSINKYQLYLFNNEERFTKKIRIRRT